MDERRAAAKRICEALTRAGHRALLAGGCVRDLILGVEPKDYDVATSARPHEVAALFPKCIDVGAAFGVQIVVLPEGMFEVATFRRDGPYTDGRRPDHVTFVDEVEDARRRDLTINAMFLEPGTERVIDYVGGEEDLRARIVRTVGAPRRRFAEDSLRLLRAVRFAARLEYVVAPETLAAIQELAPTILRTSAERVRDELLKILTEGGARRAFELLDRTRLLPYILPEIADMKGVLQPQEWHPEGDVFTHTLLILELMKYPSPTLAMSALLHDVGKPPTQTFEDRIRFNHHDKAGARMSEAICRRLRISNEDTARIAWLVENHMRLAAAPDMRASKLKRFIRHDGFGELLELCRLDRIASHGSLEDVQWVEDYIAHLPPEQLKPPRLITGDDLIAMGYEPGPRFSEILRAVEDAQLEGQLATEDDAREYVRTHWPPTRKDP